MNCISIVSFVFIQLFQTNIDFVFHMLSQGVDLTGTKENSGIRDY